jgi:hypothetical protein
MDLVEYEVERRAESRERMRSLISDTRNIPVIAEKRGLRIG